MTTWHNIVERSAGTKLTNVEKEQKIEDIKKAIEVILSRLLIMEMSKL